MTQKLQISVIVPAYNEEKAIRAAMTDLLDFLSNQNLDFEIIVINDGSTDKTLDEIKDFSRINPAPFVRNKKVIPISLDKRCRVKIINHPYNKGYGAAVKTGLRNASYDKILLFDADGQHSASDIKKLLPYINDFDMVVGARTFGYKGPMARQPGKKLLNLMANYLSGHKIPDVNSGFRLFKKDCALKFINLYPNAFSISTTMTLAFLKDGLNIKYVFYEVSPRIGKSTVKLRDGFKTMMLILRIIMLFSPLRVFLPLSFIIFLLTLISFVQDLLIFNLTETTIFLGLTSILLFSLGLLADQLADIRRELKGN